MQLMTAVAEGLVAERYAQHEVFGTTCHMYILSKGIITRSTNLTLLLKPGSVWGEDHMILSCKYLFEDVSAVSQSFSEVLVMPRARFQGIVKDHPEDHIHLRKCYVKLSVIRGVLYMVKQVKKELKKAGQSPDGEGATPREKISENLVNRLAEQATHFQTMGQIDYKSAKGTPLSRKAGNGTTIGSPSPTPLATPLATSKSAPVDVNIVKEYSRQVNDLTLKMESLKAHVRSEIDITRNAMDEKIDSIDRLVSSIIVGSTIT